MNFGVNILALLKQIKIASYPGALMKIASEMFKAVGRVADR